MNNNNNNKGQFNEWFREIKKDLLISEPQNIAARAQCCQNIINESITHLNMQLGLSQLNPSYQYKCNIDPRVHLKFLIDWPGLRIGSDSAKAPKTKREYEKKAKNWLNGRRAPNYGKTYVHTPNILHTLHTFIYAKNRSIYMYIYLNLHVLY